MAEIDPVGFFGREFIAYVADCNEASVDAAVGDLEHPAHARVSETVDRCRALLAERPLGGIYDYLAQRPQGRDTSNGNLLRMEAGGELASPATSDPLAEPLAEIAIDAFPALLLPVARQPSFGGELPSPPHRLLGTSVYEHPAVVGFTNALEADALGEMFTGPGAPPFFSFPSGIGSAFGSEALPLGLLGAASVRARLSAEAFTPDLVIREVDSLLGDLRRIQSGEEISLPVVVSLHGLEVQPGVRLELPWGSLRALDQHALKAVGDAVMPVGALFVTSVSGRVTVGSATDEAGPPRPPAWQLRAFDTELETRIQKTALALLLLEQTPRVSAVPTRTVTITPVFGVGWGTRGYLPDPVPGPQGILTPDLADVVTSTASLVDNHYAPTLAIPTRRLISAQSVRYDIEDGLVDAVVAWESLFAGTDQGELTFRIAAAIAWLIGTNADERLALHRELSGLYGMRSKILHRGGAGREVSAERNRAVELGVHALRALLERHPDLVPDENRGKKIIMRGEGPGGV